MRSTYKGYEMQFVSNENDYSVTYCLKLNTSFYMSSPELDQQ